MTFTPKFVDMVRNVTTVQGTGAVTLGAAVSGYTSLASAVIAGEQFYYCIQGVDKPAEREVGRGTMQANGTVTRQPISGAPTNFTLGTKTIALVAAADWFRDVGGWINGGADSLAALATSDKSSLVAAVNEVATLSQAGAGAGANLALLFSNAAGSAVAATTLAVDTVGHGSVGQGGARYIYAATVNSAYVTANPRTAFLAADGRGFRLDPAQRLTIEMFGGRGDWNGATGTDNYAAFMAACVFYADSNRPFVPTIHLGVGAYYCAQTVEPRAVYHLKGHGSGKYANIPVAPSAYASRIVTPTNVTCWRVCRSNTTGETTSAWAINAGSSIIEGIGFSQATQGNDLTAHGVRMRAAADLIDCGFDWIAGDAIHIRATSTAGGSLEGDCNNWAVRYCNAHQCGGNGLYIMGADTNAGYSIGFWTNVGVDGCGILDNSYFGCAHYSPQLTGYGNNGVNYGGRRYALITSSTTAGGATTPGTNLNIWYDVGIHSAAWDRFPDWVSNATYLPRMPFFGATGASTLYNPYVETSSIPVHSAGPVIGGNAFTTSLTPTLNPITQRGLSSMQGVGHYRSTGGDTSHILYPKIGDEESIFLGAQGNATTDVFERSRLLWYRVKGWDYNWEWQGENLVFTRFNGNTLFSWGGPDTPRTYGRSTTQPDRFTLHDYALQNPNDSNQTRIHGLRDAAPTTGHHAAGEFVWNVYPTATGSLGWVCTTAGTPGTWTAVSIAGFGGTYTADSNFGTITIGEGVDGKALIVKNTSGYSWTSWFNANTSEHYTDVYKTGVGYGYQFFRAARFDFRVDGNDTINITANGLELFAGKALRVSGLQVVGAQGAAVSADATDLATALTLVNELKARLRAHGLIA